MTQYRVHHNKNYTCINNTIVTDHRLSWKAKGIWLYAFSRPDDWVFNKEDIINQSTDKTTSVESALKELENCGYLVRVRKRDSKGRLGSSEWTFFEVPMSKEELKKIGLTTHFEPRSGFPILENQRLLNTEVVVVSHPSDKEHISPKDEDTKNSIEQESKTAEAFLKRASDSLSHNLNIKASQIKKLMQKYGIEYVFEQIDYMIDIQNQHFKDVKKQKSRQTRSIDKPETYLRLSCENNWGSYELP